MTNLSTKPQVIKKGQRIGSARIIDERNYAKPQELYDTAQHECHINHMSVHDQTNTRHVDIDLSASKLTKQQKQQVQELVNNFSDCFVDPKNKKLGFTELVTHKIRLKPNAKPVRRFPYRQSPVMRVKIEQIIQEQIKQKLTYIVKRENNQCA